MPSTTDMNTTSPLIRNTTDIISVIMCQIYLKILASPMA